MNKSTEKITLIFDPVMASNYLFKRLNDFNVRAVVVFSDLLIQESLDVFQKILENLSKNSDYQTVTVDQIDLSGDLLKDVDLLQHRLSNFNVETIIYGFEGSQVYVEQVSYALYPDLSNNPKTSLDRTTKFSMQSALEKANLPHIKQMKISSVEQVEKEVDQILSILLLPVVVKPSTGGGGSIATKYCETKKEVIQSVKQGFVTTGIDGKLVAEIVVQEYIGGDEYVIDMATHQGVHIVNGVFKYSKYLIKGEFVYNSVEKLSEKSANKKMVEEFGLLVADALQVKTGLSHIEIKKEGDNIHLIEYNGRISGSGGQLNFLSLHLNGMDQLTALYLNLLHHEDNESHKIYHFGKLLFFQNVGFKYKCIDLSKFTKLQSYAFHIVVNPECSLLKQSKTMLDIVLIMVLLNNDLDILNDDILRVSAIEKNGEYAIE